MSQPTRDQIRTAIRRYLASRAALDDAALAKKAAVESENAATMAFNSALRDLAAVTGDAGFVFEGRLIRISVPLAQGALSVPTVTVCPFANLDTLDPPAVPVPPSATMPVDVSAKPSGTPSLKAGYIPPGNIREGKSDPARNSPPRDGRAVLGRSHHLQPLPLGVRLPAGRGRRCGEKRILDMA